jgi:hypothetical protein
MNNQNLINRMQLNSIEDKDQKFRSSIKYIVSKYIENDIPELIECDSLKETIVTAYKLFLSNELHNISIVDKKQYIDSTDALNYFIDNYTSTYREKDIEDLREENKTMLNFIKENKAEKMYNEYRKKVNR